MIYYQIGKLINNNDKTIGINNIKTNIPYVNIKNINNINENININNNQKFKYF